MRFTWCQPDQDAHLTPYNLEGARAYMQLRQRYGSPVLLDLDSDRYGGIIVEPVQTVVGNDGVLRQVRFRGCMEIWLRPEQTLAVAARRGRYDLVVEMPTVDATRPKDVEVHRVLQGAFEMSRAVTIPKPEIPKAQAVTTYLTSAPSTPIVELTWEAVPAAVGYEVMRNGVLVAATDAARRAYRDVPETTGVFLYTVRATNVWGQTTDSDPVPVDLTPVPIDVTPVEPAPVEPAPVVEVTPVQEEASA